jgi:serine/threonine-protein kinase
MGEVASPVRVGDLLAGKYRIDRVLGAGGMGVVVAATHEELDQRVAIKFLLPAALENADVVARFKREARAAVKIQSEHVAHVIDVGTLESGAPYMVMEYLEGIDLAQKISDVQRLSVGETVQCILEACEALAEAHAAGIVHRDLKPANLFLAKRADKTSMVKVLDFGISKSALGGAGGITSTQAVMGSPYYMSPEQLMSAKHVDHRSDIWSLGIVMYESLVGTPPYLGDTMPEIVAKILQAGVPSIHAQRDDVPAELDAVIAKCLAKDASARYRDVAELANALGAFAPNGQRSLDRISRVLGGSVRPAAVTPIASAATPTVGGMTAAMPLQNRVTPTPGTTAPAWAGTQIGIPKKSNARWIAIGAVAIAGVAAIVVVGLSHRESSPPNNASVGIVASVAPDPTPEPIASIIPAPPALDTPSSASTHTSTIPPPLVTRPAIAVTTTTHPTATAAKSIVSASPPPPTAPPATTQPQQGSLHMGIK